MSETTLKLIAGLGNPGAEYARTRHNVGFWLVDELARRHGGTFRPEPRHQAELARARIGATDVWLAKPMTYMNASGAAVGSVARFYKIAPQEILVVSDELDFPPGTVRLKQGGGAAGHNGVRDIIAAVGEPFWRMRIGIGRPGAKAEGIDHVLSRPTAEEERLIRETIGAGADAVPVMLEHGAQLAMNRLHARDEPGRDEPARDEPTRDEPGRDERGPGGRQP